MRRQRDSMVWGLHFLLFLNGAGGFAGQLIWVRRLGWGLGAELPSVLALSSAVLAGLALGAWLPERLGELRRRPVRTYVLGNLITAFWLPASGQWLAGWSAWAGSWLGADPAFPTQWAVSFLGATLVLLPALLGLGLALPSLEILTRRLAPARRGAASLYAAQTLGELSGLLGGGLWAAARWGDPVVLAFGGAALALSALGVALAASGLGRAALAPQERTGHVASRRESVPRLGWLLFGTGCFGVGFEMLAVRGLREQLEGTVYTHGLVLGAYLAGSASGAAWRSRGRQGGWTVRRLLLGLATGAGWSAVFLGLGGNLYDRLRVSFGGGWAMAVGAQAVVTLAAVFPAAWWMGATFAELIERWRERTGRTGAGLALNLGGGALAPALSAVGLVPLLGVEGAMGLIVLGYAGCALLAGGIDERFAPSRRRARRWLLPEMVAAVLGLVLAGGASVLFRADVPLEPGSRVLAERVGAYATVQVIEERTGERTLRVGRHWNMGGTGSARREWLQGHLALLWHPAPRRALFLGAGTGITLSAAEAYSGLEAVGVELVPEVIELASWFAPASGVDQWPARLQWRCADARRFVVASPGSWDVIVGDLFHPGREGAAALFTLEHFRRVRQALRSGGVFVQWLPLHQLQGQALQSVIRTFLEVFPDAWALWLDWEIEVPVLGLVGSGEPLVAAPARVELLVAGAVQKAALERVGLRRSLELWGRVAADWQRLAAWADGAPVNRDAHPVLSFLAPTWTVDLRRPAFDPVRDWLALPSMGEGEAQKLLGTADSERTTAALAAYWRAGRVWMAGLVAEAEGRPEKALQFWLESVRMSADFNRAYARCLTLATRWAREQPQQARQLLQTLDRLRPQQPVARRLLERLGIP